MSLHQSGEHELPLALPQPFPKRIKGIHKLSAEAFGMETLDVWKGCKGNGSKVKSRWWPRSCRVGEGFKEPV